jgi:hypothetical protein
VRERVGLAIVPGITVRQELADGTLVSIPMREVSMPRRTLMIYRDQGYLSDSASELIKLVRSFNWTHAPVAAAGAAKSLRQKGRKTGRHVAPVNLKSAI